MKRMAILALLGGLVGVGCVVTTGGDPGSMPSHHHYPRRGSPGRANQPVSTPAPQPATGQPAGGGTAVAAPPIATPVPASTTTTPATTMPTTTGVTRGWTPPAVIAPTSSAVPPVPPRPGPTPATPPHR